MCQLAKFITEYLGDIEEKEEEELYDKGKRCFSDN